MTPPSISIILLAYNEEGHVTSALEEVRAYARRYAGASEILLIDDGSTDKTRERALAFASEEAPRIRVISHPRNLGMGAGMRTGIQAARCDYFTFLSADGQAAGVDLDRLWPKLGEADFVVSLYRGKRALSRRVLSKGMRAVMRVLLNYKVPLEGIYLFPRQVALEDIGLGRLPSDTFFFSFELLNLAVARGHTHAVAEVPYRVRETGGSKVANPGKILQILKEIMAARRRSKGR